MSTAASTYGAADAPATFSGSVGVLVIPVQDPKRHEQVSVPLLLLQRRACTVALFRREATSAETRLCTCELFGVRGDVTIAPPIIAYSTAARAVFATVTAANRK